jgi:hypothetical protein
MLVMTSLFLAKGEPNPAANWDPLLTAVFFIGVAFLVIAAVLRRRSYERD